MFLVAGEGKQVHSTQPAAPCVSVHSARISETNLETMDKEDNAAGGVAEGVPATDEAHGTASSPAALSKAEKKKKSAAAYKAAKAAKRTKKKLAAVQQIMARMMKGELGMRVIVWKTEMVSQRVAAEETTGDSDAEESSAAEAASLRRQLQATEETVRQLQAEMGVLKQKVASANSEVLELQMLSLAAPQDKQVHSEELAAANQKMQELNGRL